MTTQVLEAEAEVLEAEAVQDGDKKRKSRWAQAADYFRSQEAGHLTGKSDEALTYVRDFRKNFDL